MKTLKLPDGRTLAYEDTGEPKGKPVLFQHGTGDSRLCKYPDDSITKSLGIRLITADRPGVGGSSPRKHRSILDWVPDIEALGDELNIEKFVVAGHSGGGPHALAIAKELKNRVTKVALAAPLAPFDESGTRAMVKDKDLKMIFKMSHFKFLADIAGKVESKHYLKNIKGFVDRCAKAYPSDKVVFNDPILEPMFEAEFTAALQQGGIGALNDMWAFLDWGFKPESITQQVEIFCGDSDEILDPQMSERLAKRLPNAQLHSWSGAGHYGVYALDHWKEFLGSMV